MQRCLRNICALIPTYNNAGTIVDVVRRTCAQLANVIVAVDGSTDDTLALLQASGLSCTVISWPQNRGKGYALKRGFDKALEMGFEYVITLDGDGQHFPEDIPVLIDKQRLHHGSIIVGARQNPQGQESRAAFANRFSNFWFHVQTGLRLADTQSGFRMYPLRKIGYRWLTRRYESELELLVFAAWRNVPVYTVPVRVYYPPKEERVSHFKPAYDFTRISLLNCVLCMLALVYGLPSRFWRTIYCELAFFGAAWWCRLGRGDLHERIGRGAKWVMNHLAGNHFQIIQSSNLPIFQSSNLQISPSVVYIANHVSMYDILAVLSVNPKTVVLSQNWVYSNPFFGKLAERARFYSVVDGIEAILPKLREAVEDGFSILIFPEGTRSMDGDIIRFHRGAFFVAETLGLPIQPLLIRGMFEVLSKAEFRLGKSDVTMEFLPLVMLDDQTFGVGYRKRAKGFERYYKALLRTDKTALVLGAGVGGLFTAALLAKNNFRVTVLEQLPVAGGGLYSYEKLGAWWQTGVHVVSGMGENGAVRNVLNELEIDVPVVPCEPDVVHGKGDYLNLLCGQGESRTIIEDSFKHGAYRFAGGTRELTDKLCAYITAHGGRVLLSQRVERLDVTQKHVSEVITADGGHFAADVVVSSLHPKKLMEAASKPVFRPIAVKRLTNTWETVGSFKVYIKFKPQAFDYLPANHYIMPEDILFLTPPVVGQDQWARTMEIIAPLDYAELAPWHEKRGDNYLAWKTQQAEQLIDKVAKIYPDFRNAIEEYFTSSSLTYRDDYLSPEGAMFGLSEPVGAVTTQCDNLWLTGQNCLVHGFCGTIMTAVETAQTICGQF